MTSNDLLRLFHKTGALHEGHFKLSSGLHSATYFQSALALEHPKNAATLGKALARKLRPEVETVCSPALGGLIIGFAVAEAADKRFIFTERGPNREMLLRRGFAVKPGEKIAVVEDVVTTGTSSEEVVKVLEEQGARVAQLLCLVDRSIGDLKTALKPECLLRHPAETFPQESCRLCRERLPLDKPGSR